MSTSLAEALAVVAPGLPRVFFDEARLAALDRWARNAPPVAWAGFECPLGDAERWVDFHQGFRREEIAHLMAWLEKRAHTANGDGGWITSLLEFCREWGRNDSLFHKAIPNLIFEYDVRNHPERISSPSVFFALARDDRFRDENTVDEALLPATKRDTIEAVLKLFLEPARVAMLMRGIERCIAGAPDNATISHLGMMLARNTPAVRLNVRSLHADQFVTYLDAIGWKGSNDGLEDLLCDMFAFANRINLCIDVGEEIGIPIGLECSTHLHDQVHWDKLLKHLVEASVCTEAQREDLQKWWARETPQSSSAPWPSNLIVEGLLEKPDRFALIERYLSHIKVTWLAGAPLKFKSYLGFTHYYRSKRKTSQLPTNPFKRAMVSMPSELAPHPNDLERAISGALNYLLRNRLLSGMWHDFPASAVDDPWFYYFGASDEWVSAYVASVVGAFERDDARRAAQWVWRVLCHRRRIGEGWGFGVVTATDADSTVWGLHLAHVVGASKSPNAVAAYDFLGQHQHADGGLATYLPEASIRLFTSSGVNPWCEAHACVTAAAANLPQPRPDWLRFLRSAQQTDGRWDGFWWMDSEYATGLATAALVQSGDPNDCARIESALRWTSHRVGADGGVFSTACKAESPFATAWSLRTLLSASDHSQARALAIREVQWLIGEQRPDGAWNPSAWLQSPPVDVNDPNGFAKSIVALDRNANFTTASVLAALGLARGIWKSY
ncbi:MAG TPA: hypothetical protein VKV03_02790 [Candidatus Binataceae bacterium]|nr:hypothetical protein [Candidatus Binataceae bacterium]